MSRHSEYGANLTLVEQAEDTGYRGPISRPGELDERLDEAHQDSGEFSGRVLAAAVGIVAAMAAIAYIAYLIGVF